MQNNAKTYQPARLVKGAEPRVEFYVLNPKTGKMVRRRQRIPGNLSNAEIKAFSRNLIDELNLKLRDGWNPFVAETVPRSTDSIVNAVDRYLNSCSIEMRENSMRSYRSYCKALANFLKVNNKSNCSVADFGPIDALRLMERFAMVRSGSPRTYNNYLMAYRRIWCWFIEHKYTDVNVFSEIRAKRLTPKFRESIDASTRKRVADHLRKSDWRFLVVCELVYFCLLRPNEIVQLKPRMIDIRNQVITIPGHISKNKREQHVTIPDVFVDDLRELLDQAPCRESEYLFSDGKSLMPGQKSLNARSLSKRWARLRKKIDLPANFQLYSLKDAGITQLILNGTPANEVMHQARHHSLEITSVYIKRANREASSHIKSALKSF